MPGMPAPGLTPQQARIIMDSKQPQQAESVANVAPADAEQLAKDVADSLYDWMVEVMPNGGLLNAAVVCDYAGQQNFKRDLAKQVAQALRERPAQVEVAGWQRRYTTEGMGWSPWREWIIDDPEDPFPAMSGRWKNEYRQVYTTPPLAVDVAALRVMVEKLAAHVRPTCCELWDEAQAVLAQQQGDK